MRAKYILRRIAKVYLAVLVALSVGSFLFITRLGQQQNIQETLAGSSWTHWMGTDSLGRDLALRILQGGQLSLSVGLLSTLLTLFIGTFYGTVAGWSEGIIDKILMRFADIFSAIPSFVTTCVFCLFFQLEFSFENTHLRSFVSLVLGISLTHWMTIARVTRGLVLETKQQAYVQAAESLGATQVRIIIKHILPNIKNRVLTLSALMLPTYIMYESYMSFIGLGVQPPWTSWGLLLQEGWKTLAVYPHLMIYPSLILFLTIWFINLLLSDELSN